ncbi:TatD family hydrolase [Aureibacter tunicatorum]|uniref:TatD DNase family protein n=1 Tax=Aureibacter tunicatorum TaxID=866807 RepID=A0AAE3XTB1_9BACT|nr:TatD family hydrolase [Aureibacter tunicatorum]MDR6241703.1 TatD DNase family protein [Aureibacter tunicatorum]BDD07312.1 TatD family hydrolase [Aureibacter tunicatorum]
MRKIVNVHKHSIESEDEVCIRNFFPNEINNMAKSSYYSVGIHPWFIKQESLEIELEAIKKCAEDESFLAVGECGLDRVCNTDFDLQRKVFVQQIAISEAVSKPMVIHSVKAYSDILSYRKKMKLNCPWIIHGFQGSVQIAEQLIDKGCFLSFGKAIFRRKIQEVFEQLPLQKLFLETDEDQIKIAKVLESASEVRNMEKNELNSILWDNFSRIFGF